MDVLERSQHALPNLGRPLLDVVEQLFDLLTPKVFL
jgi:hypothetical protein